MTMALLTYLKSTSLKPPGGQRMFAALAFDLGIQSADDVHPPTSPAPEFTDTAETNGPSGPWFCVAGTWHAEKTLMSRLAKYYIPQYVERYRLPPASVSLYTYYSPCSDCTGYLDELPGRKYYVKAANRDYTIGQWFLGYGELYFTTNTITAEEHGRQMALLKKSKPSLNTGSSSPADAYDIHRETSSDRRSWHASKDKAHKAVTSLQKAGWMLYHPGQ